MKPYRMVIGATPFRAAAGLNASCGRHAMIRTTGRVDARQSSTRRWGCRGPGLSAAALIDMGEPAPQAALHVALYSQVHVSVALELFAVARPGKSSAMAAVRRVGTPRVAGTGGQGCAGNVQPTPL